MLWLNYDGQIIHVILTIGEWSKMSNLIKYLQHRVKFHILLIIDINSLISLTLIDSDIRLSIYNISNIVILL